MAIEQLGNSLRFTVFMTAGGRRKTGLTMTAEVYQNDTLIVTETSATEIGGGLYRYTLAGESVDTKAVYVAIFMTEDETVDAQHVAVGWAAGVAGVEHLDADVSTRLPLASYTAPPTAAAVADAVWDESASAHNTAGSTGAKLNLITSVGVTITDPVATDGDVTIRQGKAYTLTWTLDDPPVATDISFQCLALGFTKAGSYNSPTISVTLTSAETALFGQGVYPFEIEATVGGVTVALVTGNITVQKDR